MPRVIDRLSTSVCTRRSRSSDRVAADPATRIISLTVTEGGYNSEKTTARFDAENPDIQHDLAGDEPR